MNTPKPWRDLTDAEKGALLLAHHEGKRIEVKHPFYDDWDYTRQLWAENGIYRIAPERLTPDSINWEHVAQEYNFMARDENSDHGFLYHAKPRLRHGDWGNESDHEVWNAEPFASYRRGTVDWKDSLVIRPGYEAS